MTATVRQVVDDALGLAGELAGSGVQMFSEDRVFDFAVRAFDMLFKKYPWHQYRKWYQLTLDGALGIITTDALEKVKDFEDFFYVSRDGDEECLPLWPKDRNPYGRSIGGSSTTVQFWTSLHVDNANYIKRKLQFYPVTSTGLINVGAMEYPLSTIAESWDWEDVWYIDRQLLVYATAFVGLVADDLNSNAASVISKLMNDRFSDIKASIGRIPKAIMGSSNIPNDWFVR